MADELEESKAEDFIDMLESLITNIVLYRLIANGVEVGTGISATEYRDRIDAAKEDLKELMEEE